MSHENEEVWIFLLAKFFVPIVAVIAVIVICIANCADDTDPTDKGWARVEHVCNLHVLDSTGEGFRIAYVTSKPVTPERLKEIINRKSIDEAMERLKKDAVKHFGGNLLHTDIYDFATFVKKYSIDPILEIHCIFVDGKWKRDLYVGPNPNIPNYAEWIDPNTEQGVLWINSSDVKYSHIRKYRRYRYWKCHGLGGLYETSDTDEHFSHFSEDDRIR